MKRFWRVARWAAVVVGALLAALLLTAWIVHEPRPEGRSGAEAEALASQMEEATGVEAWHRTGAVRWTFAGTSEHLWDRHRHLARVRWGDREVLLHAGEARGRAYRAGQEVGGGGGQELVDDAYARFINDSFWLNPIAKLRDRGVTLSTVELGDDRSGLLVSYASGGLTPGDAYLWIVDGRGLPQAWKLWVSVLPIGGVETSWDDWTTLSTGARIARRHEGPLGITLELSDVEGAATLEELVDGDPFAPLFE